MALYHLSAAVIGRSQGRSSVQVAAYQARDRIFDEHNQQPHDYRKKGGLVHAEILAPDNTPDWMRDRAQLWNGLEKAEKRKDSQLCRWFDIALPHELSDTQRLELIRGFAREQWVSKGLIADIAIHTPGDDQRNHHAHVLIAMRSVTAGGFGPKAFRGTHAERQKVLEAEREAWASHQNRTFERLGLEIRVDHRSFEKRGIDMEPTKHMGANAAKLEKSGEPSRIGDENRAAVQANTDRAKAYRELADEITAREPADLKPEAERIRKTLPPGPLPRRPLSPVFQLHAEKREPKDRFEREWAQRDHERRVALERRETFEAIDLGRKHQTRSLRLEEDITDRNAVLKATMRAEIEAIDRRLQARGVTRFFRNAFGWTVQDKADRAAYEKTLAKMAEREREERDAETRRQERERKALTERYAKLRQNLEDHIALRNTKRKEQLFGKKEAPAVPDREVRPKKPEPKLEIRPPGPAKTPFDQEVFARQARDWAATPEGRKATAKDPSPREDWGRIPTPKHDPADIREAADRARDSADRLLAAKKDLARTLAQGDEAKQERLVEAAHRQNRDDHRTINDFAGKPKDHFSQRTKDAHAPAVQEDWAKAAHPAPDAGKDWTRATPEAPVGKDHTKGRD